jgi:hypothetical protein
MAKGVERMLFPMPPVYHDNSWNLNDFELPNDQPASALDFSHLNHVAGQKGCSKGSGNFYKYSIAWRCIQ